MVKEQVCAVWENSPGDKKEHHRGQLVPLVVNGDVLRVCKSCQRDLLNLEAFMHRTTIAPKESVAKCFVGGEKSSDSQSRSKSKMTPRKQVGLDTFRQSNQICGRKSAKSCDDTPLGK